MVSLSAKASTIEAAQAHIDPVFPILFQVITRIFDAIRKGETSKPPTWLSKH
jgi:hypothetical protein